MASDRISRRFWLTFQSRNAAASTTRHSSHASAAAAAAAAAAAVSQQSLASVQAAAAAAATATSVVAVAAAGTNLSCVMMLRALHESELTLCIDTALPTPEDRRQLGLHRPLVGRRPIRRRAQAIPSPSQTRQPTRPSLRPDPLHLPHLPPRQLAHCFLRQRNMPSLLPVEVSP